MSGNTPPHLRTVLATSAAREEDDRCLPSLGDGDYRPFARPSHRPLYAIHFITRQGSVRSFQYMHLDSDSSYSSECVMLRFNGFRIMNVLIAGRNLWELYDYIHQHRTAWVREAARDFAADREAIVTNLSFIAANEPQS